MTAYAGGWSDYLAQRADTAAPATAPMGKTGARPGKAAKPAPKPKGLSFVESDRLAKLPAEIARLEAEIAKLEGLLSDAELFTREPVKFRKATEALTARQTALAAAEEDWLKLAERAEAG